MISKAFLLGLLLAIVLFTSLSGVAAQDGFDEDLSTAPADNYQDGDMGSDYGYGGEEELEGTGQPETAKQLNSWDEIEKFVKVCSASQQLCPKIISDRGFSAIISGE